MMTPAERSARNRRPPLPRGRAARALSHIARKAAADEGKIPSPERIPVQPGTGPVAVAGKLGSLVELMRRPEGASLQQLCAVTNWQPHSVRGAMAGSLKRSRGYEIASTRVDGVRIYRIAPLGQEGSA